MGGTDFGYAMRMTSMKSHNFGHKKNNEGFSIFGHLKISFLHIYQANSVQLNAIEQPSSFLLLGLLILSLLS